MAMISPDTVQKIYDAIRIEEVIGDFVNLKKRGSNYVALSPFVNEKTPSFYVAPVKGIFKCFSSNIAGDAVKFVMEHEKMSYPEALRYIAKKYNIEIEEKELSAEAKQAADERELLFNINKFAQQFFSDQLHNTEEGKAVALTYLLQRGLTIPTIQNFGIGYSPNNRRAFTDYALHNGYTIEQLSKAGLTIMGEKGNYDFFFGRVVFPFFNISGRIIGFSARTLSSESGIAKYKNSPETEIYIKSKTLFGIYQARKAIATHDNCFLAEGQMDVISLSQAGLENVVASSGTSLTADQIRLIKRYAKNTTILYDGDKAGIKAALRGIDMILQEGLNVKIVLFPEGEDPDSFSKKVSNSELKEYIQKNSVDFIRYKTKVLLDEVKNDPIQKTNVIKDIVNSISLIPDNIARSIYLKECSQLLDVDEQVLIGEINALIRKKYIEDKRKEEVSGGQEKYAALPDQYINTTLLPEVKDHVSDHLIERDLARIIVKYSDQIIQFKITDDDNKVVSEIPISVAEFVYTALKEDNIQFDNPIYRKVFNALEESINNNIIPNDDYFLSHHNDEVKFFAIGENTAIHELSENWKNKYDIITVSENQVLSSLVVGSVYTVKISVVDRLKNSLLESLKSGDFDEMKEQTVQLLMLYDKARKKLSSEHGRVILK
jgi:DNA primase